MIYIDYKLYEVNDIYPDWLIEFIRCREWIENALEYSNGTFNIIDIIEGVSNGELHLWENDTAVVITQITLYPRKKVIHAFLAGGDVLGVRELEKQVVSWGKSQGCHAITLVGRPGWNKSFLTKIGYNSTHVSMIKEI